MVCKYKKPLKKDPGYDCAKCQKDHAMPNKYCCLVECGEHEFCRGCTNGIYLKK